MFVLRDFFKIGRVDRARDKSEMTVIIADYCLKSKLVKKVRIKEKEMNNYLSNELHSISFSPILSPVLTFLIKSYSQMFIIFLSVVQTGGK